MMIHLCCSKKYLYEWDLKVDLTITFLHKSYIRSINIMNAYLKIRTSISTNIFCIELTVRITTLKLQIWLLINNKQFLLTTDQVLKQFNYSWSDLDQVQQLLFSWSTCQFSVLKPLINCRLNIMIKGLTTYSYKRVTAKQTKDEPWSTA